MDIRIYRVKDIDSYWERLNKGLEILVSTFLRDRYEYGTNEMCSESGIQGALVHYAERIAREQNLHIIKARCLCLAAGLCFPPYGSAGLSAVREYIKEKGMDINIQTLPMVAIERKIARSGSPITPELDEALRMYFFNSGDDPEVNVAKYCQRKLMEAREFMKKGVFAGQALTDVMDPAVEEYRGDVQYSLEFSDAPIPEEVRKEIFQMAEEFTGYDGPEGIYELL